MQHKLFFYAAQILYYVIYVIYVIIMCYIPLIINDM